MKSDLELSGMINQHWLAQVWEALHTESSWMSREQAHSIIIGAHVLCGDLKVSSDLSLLADIAYSEVMK